jgi:iron complex outermembrane recepter protein
MKLLQGTCVAVVAVVGGVVATSAMGQSSAPELTVEEIVVTAQRREENLQKVPISVTPVTGEDLDSRKINDLTQITLAVPSFQTGMDNSFAVRGVGSIIFVANIDSSVGVAVDEVSLGVPVFMSNGILDDIARVEVLTGPQGLLFGRNSSAGLLNIVSGKPVIGKFEGNFSQEFDNRDSLPGSGFGSVSRGTVNVPLSDTAALRFNGLYSYQNPIVKHIGTKPPGLDDNQSRLAGKAKLLLKPNDKLSVYLIGDYSRERGIGAIFDRSYRSLGASSINRAAIAADGITPSVDNFLFASGAASARSVDTYGVSTNVSYDFGNGFTLSNIAAWRAFKLDLKLDTDFTSGRSIDTNHVVNDYNQYSEELRLAFHPSDRLNGQVGVYYFQTDLGSTNQLWVDVYGAPPPGFDAILGTDGIFKQTSRSVAGFGQIQYRLFDGFQVLVGGRVTDDHVRLKVIQQNTARYIAPGVFGPTITTPTSFTVNNTDFSSKFGVQYDFTPSIMGYVTYGKGYKGPSFNTGITPGTDPTINPESAHSLEAGIKSTLLDQRLRLNVALFTSKFDHFQVQSSNGVAFITQSVATVRSKGIELSVAVKPFSGLTVNVGATLLDSKFIDYPGAPCYAGQADRGCSASAGNDAFNAAGLRTPLAARFTSTTQAIYEFPVGNASTAFVQGNYYHRSGMNFTFNGNPGTQIGSVDTLGASIGFRPSDKMEFALFCKNCTDQKVPSVLIADIFDANAFNSNTIVQSFNYDSVRTIGLSGSVRF